MNNMPAEYATIREGLEALDGCLPKLMYVYGSYGEMWSDWTPPSDEWEEVKISELLAALDALAAREGDATPPAPPAAECAVPQEGQIVFVQGGIAQFRGGTFYTGMEEPRYQRPITWRVDWWHSAYINPVLATPCQHGEAQSEIARLRAELADAKEVTSRFIESGATMREQLAKVAVELTQARKATDEAHTESMFAHRWFAARFGEVMNGRDFLTKAQIADRAMCELAAELRRAVDALRPFADVCAGHGVNDVSLGMLDAAFAIVAAYDAKHGK